MKPRTLSRNAKRHQQPRETSLTNSQEPAHIADVRHALKDAMRELARQTKELESTQASQRAQHSEIAAERELMRKLLHDGLGQILTSATFLAQGVHQRLAALGLPEKEAVEELILLLNQAIAESRTLASRCEPTAVSAPRRATQTS